jgi:hypothetical protein
MKAARVKEEHITCLQFHRDRALQQWLVLREIGPQEQRLVQSLARSPLKMGARQYPQTPVLQGLVTQRNPDVDQIPGSEVPVSGILMPAGIAAESRLFRHDAVMVDQRHHDVWSQQLL